MSHKKNNILPLVIITFCVWTLVNLIAHLQDYYSILSIVIGLTSVALYYKNHSVYDKLMYIWIYMQVPNIVYSDFPVMASFPLSFGLGITLGLKNNQSLELYFNALPIGLYYMLKYFNVDKPLNHSVILRRLKTDTFPKIQFPVNGTIENISGRKKFVAIYTICLENEIIIGEKSYKHILLEPKNDTLIKPGEKHQIMGLRLCNEPNLLFDDKQNPFINWVTIECL
jgi:hypothetical protein